MKSDDRYLCDYERDGGTLDVEKDDRDLDMWELELAQYQACGPETRVPTWWCSHVLERFRACRAKLHRATAEVEQLRAENAALRREITELAEE